MRALVDYVRQFFGCPVGGLLLPSGATSSCRGQRLTINGRTSHNASPISTCCSIFIILHSQFKAQS